jgi:hypothetical protein
MKHFNLSNKKVLSVLAVIALPFLLSSCSKKIYFANSVVVPGAQGYVQIRKDKNNNYSLDINIVNLADPGRLQPPAKTYLVWMNSDQNVSKNLGQIETSGSMLSRTLKASFKSVTPLKPTRIFITAEDDAAVSSPVGVSVLTTSIF